MARTASPSKLPPPRGRPNPVAEGDTGLFRGKNGFVVVVDGRIDAAMTAFAQEAYEEGRREERLIWLETLTEARRDGKGFPATEAALEGYYLRMRGLVGSLEGWSILPRIK